MAIHLRERVFGPTGALTAPLVDLADSLGWELKDLDGGRFGLCPEPERCVPLPAAAVDGGSLHLDHAGAMDALGLVVAHDTEHVVVEVADSVAAGLGTGDLVDVTLSDVHTGAPTPLVQSGVPTAIYAWASW